MPEMADRLEKGTALSSEYRGRADVHLDDAFALAHQAIGQTDILTGLFGGLELIARYLLRFHAKTTSGDMTALSDLVAKAREIPVGGGHGAR